MSRLALMKEADALLKSAGCDWVGAKKDRNYRRAKTAEKRRFERHRRERQRQLGKFGAASPCRIIGQHKGRRKIESGAKICQPGPDSLEAIASPPNGTAGRGA